MHAGAGIDSDSIPDRHAEYRKKFGDSFDSKHKDYVIEEWEKMPETLRETIKSVVREHLKNMMVLHWVSVSPLLDG